MWAPLRGCISVVAVTLTVFYSPVHKETDDGWLGVNGALRPLSKERLIQRERERCCLKFIIITLLRGATENAEGGRYTLMFSLSEAVVAEHTIPHGPRVRQKSEGRVHTPSSYMEMLTVRSASITPPPSPPLPLPLKVSSFFILFALFAWAISRTSLWSNWLLRNPP